MQLNREDLHDAYRRMVLVREFENQIHRLNEKGELPGFIHLSAGQEASCVGICMNLQEDDYITSTHRGHGHVLAKGCDLVEMMDEVFAKRTGICHGKGGSMHMADLEKGILGANGIVGAGVPLAAGAALTSKTLGKDSISVVFFGDGAYNEGATLETMNLAKVLNLPLLFALEDNGWGEATPSSYAIGGDILKRAEGFGIPAQAVDGHDYCAVYEAAGDMISQIRAGGGPRFLHLDVYRYFGHFEGDAATYRPKGEVEKHQKERDCIMILRAYIIESGLLAESDLHKIHKEVLSEVEAAVDHARKAPSPEASDILTNVYATY
ncbi:MAG: ABC transporter substrate-binding protein [Alphaproteobacteria bacterium]|nr:MAG: ABC transporter substrate-binding protein [Alphaproteobacteria bacterium]